MPPIKVLLIEDDVSIAEVVSLCFQMKRPEIALISTSLGERGMEIAREERPDLIILDLGLPDMDGLAVLKEIRSLSQAPVIVLTVRKDEEYRAAALKVGANDYIVKPFHSANFLARVGAVLSVE